MTSLSFFPVYLSIFFMLLLSTHAAASNPYPICTEMAYDSTGRINIQSMLYNCSSFIPSPLDIPSVFLNTSGGYSPTTVSIQLSLNNLIHVDDVGNQITLDFYFRLRWVDPRWTIPAEMWDEINPLAATSDGVDLLGYVSSQAQLMVWKPDITFQQVSAPF